MTPKDRSLLTAALVLTLAVIVAAQSLIWPHFAASAQSEISSSSSLIVKSRGTSYKPQYTPDPNQVSTTAKQICGDRMIETGEECDDGSMNGFGRCSKNCQLQYCGDGTLTPAVGEECEATPMMFLDPATNQPYEELGFETRTCGDPICTPPDPTKGIAGCLQKFLPSCASKTTAAQTAISSSSSPFAEPVSVSATSSFSEQTIGSTLCGNSVKDPGEQCDTGSKNSDILPNSCRSNCTIPHCGDGVIDTNLQEQCDSGADNADAPDACRISCELPRCGDSIVDSGEQCDGGDACSPQCTFIDAASSLSAFTDSSVLVESSLSTSVFSLCGDGILDPLEQCDGGPQCSSNCTLLAVESLSSSSSVSSFAGIFCGDGIVQGSEQCDDGNRITGDGCSALCLTESTASLAISTPESATDTNLLIVFSVTSLLGFISGAAAGVLVRR